MTAEPTTTQSTTPTSRSSSPAGDTIGRIYKHTKVIIIIFCPVGMQQGTGTNPGVIAGAIIVVILIVVVLIVALLIVFFFLR